MLLLLDLASFRRIVARLRHPTSKETPRDSTPADVSSMGIESQTIRADSRHRHYPGPSLGEVGDSGYVVRT